ncbi:hypothetical protein TcasGA2_TC007425 [Tribolium castaneum]|uniref:Uncharacterized protein n=1 Tax=Tribolium castaneum TaxID=7070 RepID=D1ZZN7_TRICA|nr:hypothetical protein TcasGA2_TC007425 [Tribolium castaneum]
MQRQKVSIPKKTIKCQTKSEVWRQPRTELRATGRKGEPILTM